MGEWGGQMWELWCDVIVCALVPSELKDFLVRIPVESHCTAPTLSPCALYAHPLSLHTALV